MNPLSTKYPAIAVVGHLVKDEIKTLDGKLHNSLGGIAYNLAALAVIQKSGIIMPVCRIGFDIDDLTEVLFGSSTLFDLSGISRARRPNVVNRLVYRPDGSREEWNSSRQAPLNLAPMLLSCDALLFNFISGCDVRLSDLISFKKQFNGLIYCDFHSLSLGYGPKRRRIQRYHPRWRDYLSASDIIQMNIAELSTIARATLNDHSAIFEACKLLHENGPDIAIITAGQDGAMISIRPQGHFYHMPAIPIRNQVDFTGCGDTVSAAFLYTYLICKDPLKSLETASHYAAAKTTFSGIAEFKNIDSILSRIGPPAKVEKIF